MATHGELERVARRRRARLARGLVRAGVLTDSRWRAAFTQVPRHRFLPRFFLPVEDGWAAIAEDDPNWLGEVYTDRVLVTQLDGDPERWSAARESGAVPGVPTSSSSMPTIMAVMLEALEVADGQRALEIGTGTGYNAALLCHRLGDSSVSTVDIDDVLVSTARERLAACGYRPDCARADGADGHPAGAPYDRVLCTCSVPAVPPAWLEQTRPGGLVVTTLNRPLGAGLVRIVVGEGAAGQGRVLADDGRFMPLRPEGEPAGGRPAVELPSGPGVSRSTGLPASTVVSPASPFEFFVGLDLPGVTAVSTEDGAVLLLHPDGSWARHRSVGGRHEVTQGGERQLWDEVEKAHAHWIELGRPGRARFGITVRAEGQELWLDEPDGPYRWPLR